MKVYISGKIGEEVISDATREKFARAQAMLEAKGYEVFNPVSEKWQRMLKEEYEIQFFDHKKTIPTSSVSFYTYALLRDQMVLTIKDAVYFLDDWNRSPGAKSEYYFVKAVGKRFFFQDRHDAAEYLIERMHKEAKANGKPVGYENLKNRNDIEIAYFTKHLDEAWLPL